MRALFFSVFLTSMSIGGCGTTSPANSGPNAGDSATPADAKGDSSKAMDGASRKPRCTVVINTHEWYYHDQGAATLTRIMDLLDRYKIKGEFYVTEAVFKTHESLHPAVLSRMKADNHAISFHVRAPHSVTFVTDASKRLSAQSAPDMQKTLMDVETHELDLTTGETKMNVAGGYAYIRDKVGYAPRAAGLNPQSEPIRTAELAVLKALGLRMFIRKHTGDTLEMTGDDLVSRPSQFAIEKIDGLDWASHDKPLDPSVLLAGAEGDGVIIVHDSDFIADQAGWSQVYWDDAKKAKRPPWNLAATNPGFKFRTESHAAQIWANYEGFLSYAARTFEVVTSKELVAEWDEGQKQSP